MVAPDCGGDSRFCCAQVKARDGHAVLCAHLTNGVTQAIGGCGGGDDGVGQALNQIFFVRCHMPTLLAFIVKHNTGLTLPKFTLDRGALGWGSIAGMKNKNMRLRLFRDRKGEFRWELIGSNGKKIVGSEKGYKQKKTMGNVLSFILIGYIDGMGDVPFDEKELRDYRPDIDLDDATNGKASR